jgi:hypothetical protein
LRHPEVFDCDLKWRSRTLGDPGFREALDFTTLTSAFESMVKIEEKRLAFSNNDTNGLALLRNIVISAHKELLMRGRSKIIESGQRKEATELAQWLGVWLQSPELFSDWLDLRRRSPEFRKKFDVG